MPSFNTKFNTSETFKCKARPTGPTRTLREFAAVKGLSNTQLRSIWDHSQVAKPEPWIKVGGRSNKHYYMLSDLEDWFTMDRESLNARVLGNHQIIT